jgi:alkanesulfonate monooxygenase SsuD/methylene tetrahydromethanopterin reductase-like flavin-dependent oxidoreductase (luciferase family)
MRFATGTTVKDFAWYREWLDVAERAGFEMLTTGDSQSLWADPFVILSVAAQHTSRPRLGITVSNPVTRHPAVVASSLVALQQLSGGRVVYGMSSGDSALRNIGERPATVAELEAFGRAVQGLCAGDTVDWHGNELVLRWGSHPTPLWMAAEGPRTQFLAGQIADGVVLSNALDTEVLQLARDNVAAGAASAGRSPDDIEIWCMAAMAPAATEAEGIHRLRFLLAGTANHVYRFHMDGKALPDEHRDAIAELQRRYDSTAHATPERAEANARLVEELGLVDFLAARSVVVGPPERCVERFKEIEALGITNLIVSQFVDDQLQFMRDFAAHILPAF